MWTAATCQPITPGISGWQINGAKGRGFSRWLPFINFCLIALEVRKRKNLVKEITPSGCVEDFFMIVKGGNPWQQAVYVLAGLSSIRYLQLFWPRRIDSATSARTGDPVTSEKSFSANPSEQ